MFFKNINSQKQKIFNFELNFFSLPSFLCLSTFVGEISIVINLKYSQSITQLWTNNQLQKLIQQQELHTLHISIMGVAVKRENA